MTEEDQESILAILTDGRHNVRKKKEGEGEEEEEGEEEGEEEEEGENESAFYDSSDSSGMLRSKN